MILHISRLDPISAGCNLEKGKKSPEVGPVKVEMVKQEYIHKTRRFLNDSFNLNLCERLAQTSR